MVKSLLDDVNMLELLYKSQADIQQLKQELEMHRTQIFSIEQKLDKLFETERELKEKSQIKDGKRIQSKTNFDALEIIKPRDQINTTSNQKDRRTFQKRVQHFATEKQRVCTYSR